jgi:hypothetical protein
VVSVHCVRSRRKWRSREILLRLRAGAAAEATHPEHDAGEQRHDRQRLQVMGRGAHAPSPAKPMNATERMPAMNRRDRGARWRGRAARRAASFSRTPAISTSASVKPRPAPSA